MSQELEREVRRRADDRCEYCLIPQSAEITPHQVDHIIARKHGGQTTSENLAIACVSCNNYKGPNIAGIDPDTRAPTRLYNPRQDKWEEHFSLGGNGNIAGMSAVGRATVAVLKMNTSESVALRAMLVAEGVMVPNLEQRK